MCLSKDSVTVFIQRSCNEVFLCTGDCLVLAAVCRACVVSDGSTAVLRTVEGEMYGVCGLSCLKSCWTAGCRTRPDWRQVVGDRRVPSKIYVTSDLSGFILWIDWLAKQNEIIGTSVVSECDRKRELDYATARRWRNTVCESVSSALVKQVKRTSLAEAWPNTLPRWTKTRKCGWSQPKTTSNLLGK